MSYNPRPPRVWSRVQNRCTFTDNNSYNSVYSPLTGKTTSLLEADYYNKLLYKGNILQYKKNTSNLTKSQRYSQICKGMWTNRTKSYATQTQTYTNPNISNLKQVNYVSVPSNGNTTYIPGPFNFNIPAPNGCISDTIKDGGSLLCNTVVNPCTDEVVDTTTVLECYPTYCSDVPGAIIDLCWNPKLDTWYPRQNLTMNNSTDKWPEGYKGLVSAVTGCYNIYNENGLIITETTSGTIKVLKGTNGTITFKSNVIITEVFLVGGGNAGLTGKDVSGANGGWGGAGGGWSKLNNITVLARTPITLTVGTGGVYPVSSGIQSSFTYKGTTTVSLTNGDNWAAGQNNEGGLNNGFSVPSNQVAQDGYQYDGVWYGGGGGYGGRNSTWLVGGNGGLGGGGGGGGYTGNNGGSGGQGTGGTAGNVTVNPGSSSIYGGGGGYGIITGNGGNGGEGGGGAGGAGGAGGGGGGGGVNTGGGGGGGGYPADSGIPGNGGSGIIIIKYTIAV